MKYEHLKNKLSGLFGEPMTNEDVTTIRRYCREYEGREYNEPKLKIKQSVIEILKLTIAITLAIKLVDCMEVFICKIILM